MKWYHALVSRIIKGIVLFLLPVILLLVIFGKAVSIAQSLIHPIIQHLPEKRILGIGMLTFLSLLLILLICYIAGILAEKKGIKSFIKVLEDNVLVFIPGYAVMKSRAGEAIGHTVDEWIVVLAGEADEWKLGICVDQQPGGYSTVFFPEPPDGRSGEIKLIHESKLKKLDMPVSHLLTIIRKYGHSASALVKA